MRDSLNDILRTISIYLVIGTGNWRILSHRAGKVIPELIRNTFWNSAASLSVSVFCLTVLAITGPRRVPTDRVVAVIALALFVWNIGSLFNFLLAPVVPSEHSSGLRLLGRRYRRAVHALLFNPPVAQTVGLRERRMPGYKVLAWYFSTPFAQLFVREMIGRIDLIMISVRFSTILLSLVVAFASGECVLDSSVSLATALLRSLSTLSSISIVEPSTRPVVRYLVAGQVTTQLLLLTFVLPLLVPFYDRSRVVSERADALLTPEFKRRIIQRIREIGSLDSDQK